MFLFFLLFVHTFGAVVVNARINFGGNSNDLQFTSSSAADSCVDIDGIRRQNGEEWTVRQHFVLICHEVPSGDAFFPKMRVEVIGCLREDGQTRMAIGEQVQDDGKTLVCRREGQGPTGEVRREWQLAPGRRGFSTIGSTVPGGSSSISTFGTAGLIGGSGGGGQFDNTFASNSNDERGCFNRAIGERWQRRSFELECTSQYELPKLVACIPPELNGQRIPAGGSLNVGRFTVVCLNRPDGSYGYRYV